MRWLSCLKSKDFNVRWVVSGTRLFDLWLSIILFMERHRPHGKISFSFISFYSAQEEEEEEALLRWHRRNATAKHFSLMISRCVQKFHFFFSKAHQIFEVRRIESQMVIMTVYSLKGFCSLSLLFNFPLRFFFDAQQDLKKKILQKWVEEIF